MAIVLALWLPARAPAQDLGALARVLPEATSVERQGREVTVTLGLSQPVPFRVFTLEDPARVVADFREVLWDALPPGLSDTPGIAGIEAGPSLDAGWSRLILTLDAPMLPRIAAMQTNPTTGEAGVVLVLAPSSVADFAAASGWPDALAGRSTRAEGAADRTTQTAGAEERLVIVLDPGHGGVDPGAVRGDHTEADLVLTFARELADVLRRTGRVDVVMTREGDVFVPLPTRVSVARAAAADALISIHADALAEGRARGATVYTLSDTATDAATAALAEQHDRADILQGVDLARTDDVVAGVLMDLARVETAPRADALAADVVASIDAAGIDLHRRPRGAAGFTVLRAADIPSILLEIGFISDGGDLENIIDPDWRARMQAALAEAVLTWAETDAIRGALLRQ